MLYNLYAGGVGDSPIILPRVMNLDAYRVQEHKCVDRRTVTDQEQRCLLELNICTHLGIFTSSYKTLKAHDLDVISFSYFYN